MGPQDNGWLWENHIIKVLREESFEQKTDRNHPAMRGFWAELRLQQENRYKKAVSEFTELEIGAWDLEHSGLVLFYLAQLSNTPSLCGL